MHLAPFVWHSTVPCTNSFDSSKHPSSLSNSIQTTSNYWNPHGSHEIDRHQRNLTVIRGISQTSDLSFVIIVFSFVLFGIFSTESRRQQFPLIICMYPTSVPWKCTCLKQRYWDFCPPGFMVGSQEAKLYWISHLTYMESRHSPNGFPYRHVVLFCKFCVFVSTLCV